MVAPVSGSPRDGEGWCVLGVGTHVHRRPQALSLFQRHPWVRPATCPQWPGLALG